MSSPLLAAEEIVCGYDENDVLHGISLAMEAGEFLGVIGPNGCGKSTLLTALTGWLSLRQGRVMLAGQPLKHYPTKTVAQMVAVVPQASIPAFAFTVRETVEMGRYPHLGRLAGITAADGKIIDEALELTDVAHLQHRPVDRLSGGEYQRVTIARALAQQPKVLLLDEPTAHLDIGHQQEIFTLLSNLRTSRQVAILCVSHDINLAATYCQRIILLSQGNIVAEGSPEEVITEELLQQVYGTLVRVHAHPGHGGPLVVMHRQLPAIAEYEE